ncbi:hypothetical protein VQ042_06845 [Aurantimonas sp. A2-1-M11]
MRSIITIAAIVSGLAVAGCQGNMAGERSSVVDRSTPSDGIVPGQIPE